MSDKLTGRQAAGRTFKFPLHAFQRNASRSMPNAYRIDIQKYKNKVMSERVKICDSYCKNIEQWNTHCLKI
jgi:hypothetical protein